jgi:hypothetical protein
MQTSKAIHERIKEEMAKNKLCIMEFSDMFDSLNSDKAETLVNLLKKVRNKVKTCIFLKEISRIRDKIRRILR